VNPSDGFGVIFDMDGVVVDSEPMTIRSYLQAFREYGVQVSAEEYIRRVVVAGCRVSRLFRDHGDGAKWPAVFARKNDIYRELVREEMRMMPGALELLKELRKSVVPCALATSASRATMSIVFERFGLDRYFDETVTLDEVGNHKPHPDCFLRAAELLGLPPERCVVIEDAPKGILAAKAAGARCLAVPTYLTANEDLSIADAVVRSLEEVSVEGLRGIVFPA